MKELVISYNDDTGKEDKRVDVSDCNKKQWEMLLALEGVPKFCDGSTEYFCEKESCIICGMPDGCMRNIGKLKHIKSTKLVVTGVDKVDVEKLAEENYELKREIEQLQVQVKCLKSKASSTELEDNLLATQNVCVELRELADFYATIIQHLIGK